MGIDWARGEMGTLAASRWTPFEDWRRRCEDSGLALVKVDGLDVRVFSTPGMRGKSDQIKQRRQCTQILSPALRHLKLRDVAFSSREHYDVPPLHLTSLSLHKFLGAPNLLPSLINTSSSSLRVLSFTFADVWSGSSKTDETLARSIHLLSPSLHTLNLNFFTFEPSLLLVPIISSLKHLHSLSINGGRDLVYLPPVLETLPKTVEVMSIGVWTPWKLERMVEGFSEDGEATLVAAKERGLLKGLRRLVLPREFPRFELAAVWMMDS